MRLRERCDEKDVAAAEAIFKIGLQNRKWDFEWRHIVSGGRNMVNVGCMNVSYYINASPRTKRECIPY